MESIDGMEDVRLLRVGTRRRKYYIVLHRLASITVRSGVVRR